MGIYSGDYSVKERLSHTFWSGFWTGWGLGSIVGFIAAAVIFTVAMS